VNTTVLDWVLVGDVGGTHARFAVVDTSGPAPWRIHNKGDLTAQFGRFTEALSEYLKEAGVPSLPTTAVIAVAGPVSAGSVTFTNRAWTISESELRQFGFAEVLLINDFAALALASEVLGAGDLRTIGPALAGVRGAPISIVGAGTGFGVSCLVRAGDRVIPVATEGGHIGFAPSSEREVGVWRVLEERFGRASVERILSGPGIENLHQALQGTHGNPGALLPAAEITARALIGDPACSATLTMFCSILGTVAGDLALAHGARGGVYLAGGIGQQIATFLAASPFRARFESKGRLSHFVKSIPTTLIMNSEAALLGAARAALDLHRSA
jgi:glucokinase